MANPIDERVNILIGKDVNKSVHTIAGDVVNESVHSLLNPIERRVSTIEGGDIGKSMREVAAEVVGANIAGNVEIHKTYGIELSRVMSEKQIVERYNQNFIAEYSAFIDANGYMIKDSTGAIIKVASSETYYQYSIHYNAYINVLDEIIEKGKIPSEYPSIRKSYYDSLTAFQLLLSDTMAKKINK